MKHGEALAGQVKNGKKVSEPLYDGNSREAERQIELYKKEVLKWIPK